MATSSLGWKGCWSHKPMPRAPYRLREARASTCVPGAPTFWYLVGLEVAGGEEPEARLGLKGAGLGFSLAPKGAPGI